MLIALSPVKRLTRAAFLFAAMAALSGAAFSQDPRANPLAQAPAATAPTTDKPLAKFNTCAKPVWPRESLRREEQGTVTLAFLIGADGKVEASKIEKSSGFPLLDEAAQQGIAKCQFSPRVVDGKPEQGWMKMQYVWTLTSPKDTAILEWVRAGARQGQSESEYELGLMHLHGKFVPRDIAEGMRWLRKSVAQGNPKAQYMLAVVLQSDKAGKPDYAEAFVLARKAAEQGNVDAQHLTGVTLLGGRGIDENKVEAIQWLRKAADQGHAKSQAYLGMLPMDDPAATPEALAEGIKWLRKAVDQNESTGQTLLGMAYRLGRGVPQDFSKACALLGKGGCCRQQVCPARAGRNV